MFTKVNNQWFIFSRECTALTKAYWHKRLSMVDLYKQSLPVNMSAYTCAGRRGAIGQECGVFADMCTLDNRAGCACQPRQRKEGKICQRIVTYTFIHGVYLYIVSRGDWLKAVKHQS